MAATSLAQQLRNLKTPQTSVLHDSKKRDSILFSPKEAAEKDRDTIYEIGMSGLTELIALNPLFTKFEATLFDHTTKNVQRSVETSEFNTILNQNIRKFIIQLSPFLMLDSAHKCLEWLIRRFHINRYNRDDFILLILPYHETQIFVRCLQTISFMNVNDRWTWLQPAKKSASPLSKRTLFNHAVSSPKFMELYGKFTLEAVKDWENRAHYLKTLIGFYCTTTLGALENVALIKEVHLTSMLEVLVKGLVSSSLDLISAIYMVIAHLVSKIELSVKLLNVLIFKIASLNNQQLTVEAGMLLVLIYEVRHKNLRPMPNKLLAQFEAAKWLPLSLVTIKNEGAKIVQLYVAVMEAALLRLQTASNEAECKKYRNLCETLIKEINFDEGEAEVVIR
jgi:U3 small nucleolar RNA-associated protein 10